MKQSPLPSQPLPHQPRPNQSPPIPTPPQQEKRKFISMCTQGEFFVEPKEVEQNITLKGVSPTVEVPEEVDKSLEEYKGVEHDELLEVLPSMKDNHHNDTIILHNFKDPFLHNESTQDYSI